METDHSSQPAMTMEAGQEALARASWDEARACFETVLQSEETPEPLEGLGMAAWWLDDAATTFDARHRAYRLYRTRGDRRSAARVAIFVAWDYYAYRGQAAVASGWLGRARRLLDGLDPCPEHGLLWIADAHFALMLRNETEEAARLAAETAALGRDLGSVDLEMLALAYQGLALVSEGQIAEGMRLLDESTAAAVAGEMTDFDAICTSCCCLIYACERARDYERAVQWCDELKQFCERWSYRPMFSLCLTHYAGVLIWRGAWAEAEAELTEAISNFRSTKPGIGGESFVRLAELRRRQGRLDEAAALYRQADRPPWRMLGHHLALLGRAALALDRGDAEMACDLAGRFLRAVPAEDRTERAAAFELLVRAQTAAGRAAEARESLQELREIVALVPTTPLQASACFAEGFVAAAAGDHEAAQRSFEDAADLFDRSGAPFETCLARIELARSLHALGRHTTAEQEARAASDSLQKIGASREAERAASLLRELENTARKPTDESSELAGLTQRELEVLRLVAQGLGDREIAAALTLSEHTVHRHIANVLTKLNRPSRAAAVAHVARHGLL